jgi:hypothetical protein
VAGNEQHCETEAEGTMGDEGHVHAPDSLHQTLNHPTSSMIVRQRRRRRVSGHCPKFLVGIAQGCGRFRDLYGDEGMFHVDMTRVARGGQVIVRRGEAL